MVRKGSPVQVRKRAFSVRGESEVRVVVFRAKRVHSASTSLKYLDVVEPALEGLLFGWDAVSGP